MVDNVLINKAASIERCVARVREEYEKDPATFEFDFTRQDAAILNIQRACEAALDMGQHLIRRGGLGVPQSARDVFELLHRGGWLAPSLLPVMKNMVGFKNIAVHDYQTLQLPITVAIITQHLGDFILFSSAILRRDVASDLAPE
ncbi:toxin-antitoxin antitoxin component, partial [Pseudomonas syringae pv. actinidiae]